MSKKHKKKNSEMPVLYTREQILTLRDSDLITYYICSIKALKELRALQERANNVRLDRHRIQRKGFIFSILTILLLLSIPFVEIIRVPAEAKSNVIVILCSALAFLQMIKVTMNRARKAASRSAATAYRNCVREINRVRSNPSIELQNAMMMFEDPRDIEYIAELKRVVFKSLAHTHEQAVKEIQREAERLEDVELKRKLIKAIERNTNVKTGTVSDRIAKIVGLTSGG